MCMFTCVPMCVENKLILSVFLHCFQLYVLRLADMRLAIQLAPGSTCLHLPRAGITDRPLCPPGFSMSAEDPNSGPHIRMANILYTVSSFQHHIYGFFETKTSVLIFDSKKTVVQVLILSEYLSVTKHSTMLLWYLAPGGFLWVSCQGLGPEKVMLQAWLCE